jgi:hypothetical protein
MSEIKFPGTRRIVGSKVFGFEGWRPNDSIRPQYLLGVPGHVEASILAQFEEKRMSQSHQSGLY